LCRNIAIIDKGSIIERDRMANLLRRLHTETFVFNSRDAVTQLPPIPGFAVRQIDPHTFEIEVSKEQSLNEVFAHLTTLGINVLSMRNKVNRLEEIFMRLVENRGHA
ncbi:MAG TPA: DUF4162 domain-containing protein, partial [Steroidobacteraceae bacterium]|nr:DUF4162 domain-containing protein [Steroidobacteraceae bacterium]